VLHRAAPARTVHGREAADAGHRTGVVSVRCKWRKRVAWPSDHRTLGYVQSPPLDAFGAHFSSLVPYWSRPDADRLASSASLLRVRCICVCKRDISWPLVIEWRGFKSDTWRSSSGRVCWWSDAEERQMLWHLRIRCSRGVLECKANGSILLGLINMWWPAPRDPSWSFEHLDILVSWAYSLPLITLTWLWIQSEIEWSKCIVLVSLHLSGTWVIFGCEILISLGVAAT
jgi:hypothetical protein